jgi:hypothetical protein
MFIVFLEALVEKEQEVDGHLLRAIYIRLPKRPPNTHSP